ncbi:MAG: hypothetical protein WC139_11410 [Candidatus Kapaibacterium sp.]
MEEKIRKILTSIFDGKNHHLIDVVIRGEKKNKIAEIYVDSENGIDLDELSAISREVNSALDSDEIIGEFLKVVVSSPGAENPFKYCWQLKKHVSRVLSFSSEGQALEGRLLDVNCDSEELVFEVLKSKKEVMEIRFKFSELENLIVKLPF